jgi:hypothetical protein
LSHPINRGILELQNKPLNNNTYFIMRIKS